MSDKNSIETAELEGRFVKLVHGETIYKCLGGFGCSPESGGKIFLLDTRTGVDNADYCRRADIREIVDAPAFIPNGISISGWERAAARPRCVGIKIRGIEDTVWVHEEQLGELAQFFLKLALQKVK